MNSYKPNIKGQAELILKNAGGAAAKMAIHSAFINYKEVTKEQFPETLNFSPKFGLLTFDEFSFNATLLNKITYTASKDFGGGIVNIVSPFKFATSLIEVNQSKNIVKTSISGLNGTVKEYMSDGDYLINLKGVIIGNTANKRPDINVLNSLVAYLNAPMAIPVVCNFLDELLINSVVIESYKLGQREGARNIIDIEISMLSDSPIELSTSKSQKDIFTERPPYVQKSFF